MSDLFYVYAVVVQVLLLLLFEFCFIIYIPSALERNLKSFTKKKKKNGIPKSKPKTHLSGHQLKKVKRESEE